MRQLISTRGEQTEDDMPLPGVLGTTENQRLGPDVGALDGAPVFAGAGW